MLQYIREEPVALMQAIQLTLVVAFLVYPIDPAVAAALYAAIAAWLGFLTRKAVTPISKLPA